MSHEIRLSSPADWRMRFVGGVFYEERELEATTDWQLQDRSGVRGHRRVDRRAASCTSIRGTSPKFAGRDRSTTRTAAAPNTGFFNDFTRDYTQSAAFASVDFDILENLTLTLGTRYYDIENSFVGANMGSFYCKVYGTGERAPARAPCTATVTCSRLRHQPGEADRPGRRLPQPREPDLARHG